MWVQSFLIFLISHSPQVYSFASRLLSPQKWSPKSVQSSTVSLKILLFLCAGRKVQSKSFNVHKALNNDSEDLPFLSGSWVCRSRAPSHVRGTNAQIKFTHSSFWKGIKLLHLTAAVTWCQHHSRTFSIQVSGRIWTHTFIYIYFTTSWCHHVP